MTFYDKISKFIKCTINGNKHERHLTKEDAYDATKKCPTCGSLIYRKPVCKIQSNPSVEFLYCPTCKGCSASQMPTKKYLSLYYDNYYENSDKEITFPDKVKRFAKYICKYISINKNQSFIKILDYGGMDL